MTWDRIEEIGLGILGLPVVDLYDLTMRQFQNKMTGFFDYHEQMERGAWERMRQHAAATISMNGMVKRAIKPGKLFAYPWDKEEKPVKVTEEFKQLAKERASKWQETQK